MKIVVDIIILFFFSQEYKVQASAILGLLLLLFRREPF